MMVMKVIFSHGKESGPKGKKIQQLSAIAKRYDFTTLSVDYRLSINPDERVTKLVHILEKEVEPFVLVGSSMGGYVSLVASEYVKPLGIFLIAPAIGLNGYNRNNFLFEGNVEIVHGWKDDVVPFKNSIAYAESTKSKLHLLNCNHSVSDGLDDLCEIFESFLRQFA